MWSGSRKIGWWIKEAIAPATCVGCGQYASWVCRRCEAGVVRIREQRCVGCHVLSMQGKTCNNCKRKGWVVDAVLAVAEFDQPVVRDMVHALKYRGLSEVAETMGGWMREVLSAEVGLGEWAVVPVPLHWWRRWQRGFNQAALLAQNVAGVHHIVNGLVKVRATAPQVGLGRQRRRANLEGAFVGRLVGRRVLLVDDVATTGATLDEAARALKRAGAKEVYGLVWARG